MKRWMESVSKQLALMIFMSGMIFCILTMVYVKDPTTIAQILTTLLPSSWGFAGGLVAVKTGSQALVDKNTNKEQ